MKKPIIGAIIALTLLFTTAPALAQDITNETPSGSTEVTGIVSGDEPGGNVTYTVSIPDKIDFQTLTQPGDNKTDHNVTRDFNVSLTAVSGMTTGQVAVLMKDGGADGTFKITGTSTANQDKSLAYTVLNTLGTDITTGTNYPNGYLLSTFKNAGDSVTGQLVLNCNQLYMQDLKQWAGNYKGTITFFSKVVTANDIN